MSNDNVAAVRNAYAVAERKDLEGWISLFTPDGVFTDYSVGAIYRGRALADPVRYYGTAFSNMHRELHRVYTDGNVVVVQLALQGTHDGPLQLPFGKLAATGKQMDAPCCDVFELENGKIKRFDCYLSAGAIGPPNAGRFRLWYPTRHHPPATRRSCRGQRLNCASAALPCVSGNTP